MQVRGGFNMELFLPLPNRLQAPRVNETCSSISVSIFS